MASTQNKKVMKQAQAVKIKYESDLLSHKGVTGVGIGFRQKGGDFTEDVCIVVMVNQKFNDDDLDDDDRLPSELDGFPVDVQETGKIANG